MSKEKPQCIEPNVDLFPKPQIYPHSIISSPIQSENQQTPIIFPNEMLQSNNIEQTKYQNDNRLPEKITKQRKTSEIVLHKVKFVQYVPQDNVLLKNSKYQAGKWTQKEDELLIHGLNLYGRVWTKISNELVKTRSPSACIKRAKILDLISTSKGSKNL